jgi:nucleotide-binding universal stress UspA family protein
MSTPWRRIAVATDFSPAAGAALTSAETLARASGADLVLIHVEDLRSASYAFGIETLGFPDVREAWADEGRRALTGIATRLHRRGAPLALVDVRVGEPWREIVASAAAHGADLIVLGNAGRSRFGRLLLGSTAENVIRHSPVPVLVTRRRPLRRLRRVLVPVSFDDGSRAALAFVASGWPRGVELEAFHAALPIAAAGAWMPVLPPSLAEATRDLRAFLAAAGAKRARPRVEAVGDVASAILDRAKAWKADLILLSTHGRGGFSHLLLGSVAEKIARYAEVPVLVLPPPGRAAAAEREAGARRARKPRLVPAAAPRPVPRPPGRELRGPWTSQAHTGRGGPPGRRGSGSKAGTKTHQKEGSR